MAIPVKISDYRELAKKRLPRQLFDFIDCGAFNEDTLKNNSDDFSRIFLHKRILSNTSAINTSTEIFGQALNQPVILAPVGYAGLFAARGEIQAAKAAEAAKIPFCLSTLSICSIEEVRKSTKAPFWFQLYIQKDKGFCLELLQKAKSAACLVLIVTVDVPVVGVRYKDVRNGMVQGITKTPLSTKWSQLWDLCSHPQWFFDVKMRGAPLSLGNFCKKTYWKETRNHIRKQSDHHVTWKDLEWIRSLLSMLNHEIRVGMKSLGIANVKDIDRGILRSVPRDWG
jgi:L-lactate dehydrogenase (cytochrome)